MDLIKEKDRLGTNVIFTKVPTLSKTLKLLEHRYNGKCTKTPTR